MSQRTPACDEGLARMRADTTLRTLAELDSLEPSRALDRAVLGLARDAASGRAHRAGAGGRPLRWGFPAAVTAAAVCAVVVQRTSSTPEVPRVPPQRFVVEWMQTPRSPGESHPALIPTFIFASVPLLSLRAAPLRKHGSEEQTQRVAARSSERSLRRDLESTTRRRIRLPEPLYKYNVDSFDERAVPPPPPTAVSAAGSSSRGGASVRDARAEAASTGPH